MTSRRIAVGLSGADVLLSLELRQSPPELLPPAEAITEKQTRATPRISVFMVTSACHPGRRVAGRRNRARLQTSRHLTNEDGDPVCLDWQQLSTIPAVKGYIVGSARFVASRWDAFDTKRRTPSLPMSAKRISVGVIGPACDSPSQRPRRRVSTPHLCRV